MTYSAGTSVGVYELRADAALKTQLELIKNYQTLAKAQAIKPPAVASGGGGAALNQQAAAAQKATLAQQKLATETQKTIAGQNQAATSAQKLATEQQHTATALVNTARAEQQLARDTATASAAQDRAATVALRRRQAEDRANRQPGGGTGPALPRTFAGFTQGGLGQLAGLAGLNFGVQGLVDAGRSALALRETQNGLRAVAGTTENYTKTLRLAREQQELFGGSLQENVEGLTGLTITSRQSGAQLKTLIDLSQRLAVLDPSQGAAGARIALSEALSGDPTSLAKRYEIPRVALAKLRDETTSASEKLLIIDQYLNKVGITSQAVAGRIDQDALAFRRASAEIEEATIKLGDYLTKVAAVPARGITNLLDTGGVAPGAVDAGNAVQAKLIDKTQDYQAYADGVNRANDQLQSSIGGVVGWYARLRLGLDTLTPAQFAYAQSLIATGTASGVALQQAQGLTEVDALFTKALNSATTFATGARTELTALAPKIFEVANQSDHNRTAVDGLLTAYAAGRLSIQGLIEALAGLTQGHDIATQAAFAEEHETRRLQRVFVDIVPAANAAAAAIAGVGGAAAGLPENRHIGATGNTTGGIASGIGSGAGGLFARQDAAARALQDSRDQLALANAKTNAEKIAIFQRQLDRQTTEEGRNRILAQIAGLRNSGRTGASKGISVLDQDSIQAGETLKAQLDAVNVLLAKTNLSEHQRNDLLEKRRKLEEEITAEGEKQARASVDARLGIVQDAQKRLQEAREAAGLQRQLQSGKFSESQQNTARLRLEEISLEQQKRALDIQKDAKAAGVAIPGASAAAGAPGTTSPLPIPNVAQLPPVQAGGVNLSLTIQLNPVTGQATVVNAPSGVNVISILTKAA